MIATPLYEHAHITIDALHAGKHVFCEKSMAMTCADCLDMYNVFKESGKVMFIGQQRLYDPKYIKAMEMIHAGLLGEINSIRAYWFRNNDWRRPVPSPDLERKINWRLYKEYSCGLVTELATHQLQVGNWALRMLPEKVAGMGDIVYWKDGREVYDSINLIYHYPNGVKMTYESMIANKFYGLEEEIMGSKGTMEPEKGKYYFEDVEPAPGIMQLINQIEHKIFDNVSFAGPSWVPETASVNKGHLIMDNVTTISGQSSVGAAGDGSIELVTAFCEAAITGKPAPNLVEEAYYSSVLGLLGLQAIDEGRVITFPDEYKIPYLYSDFKKRNGYKRSIELSAQYGLYRQNYCGCIYSRIQAEKKEQEKMMKKLFLEGYSKNAIAEAFECLPETVTARIKRAEEDMNGT